MLELLAQSEFFAYPNETHVHWSLLIVLYPFLSGLVVGSYILSSFFRVFRIKALAPMYRLTLLASLSFLIVAPLTLLLHLGHPLRGVQIWATPHFSSAMAMFGFIFVWVLVFIICFEIWFDFRKDFVELAAKSKGIMKLFYNVLTLGVKDVSPKALAFDHKAARIIGIVGIPSTILLTGYVGFIFGSVKANPWWSSVLIPIIFIASAIISGTAITLLLYMAAQKLRKQHLDVYCIDKIGKYLMYSLMFGFTLELLDIMHRLYEKGEWYEVFLLLSRTYLWDTIFYVQLLFGALLPLLILGAVRAFQPSPRTRAFMYLFCSIIALIGVFAMRWNIVVGGQSYSKSLHGYTPFHLEIGGREGLIMFLVLLTAPFVILFILTKLIPPWQSKDVTEQLLEEEPLAMSGTAMPAMN